MAIIPVRGGSKRIPRKNLVNLGDKPLTAHSILNALKSKYLKNSVYVSTEDKEISKISNKYGAQVIDRPAELATDTSTTLSALKHAVNYLEKSGVEFDTVVLLQATCPFRKTSTIDAGIEKLWKNWNEYKALFSVRPSKFPPNWLLKIKNDKLEFILPNDFSKIRSQDLDDTFDIDGVLYVFNKDYLKKTENYPFESGATGFIISSKKEALDIDDNEDLKLARYLAK